MNQSCILCIIIVSIFVGDKASDKLIKYSFSLNMLSIFKSVKIGSLWSEYDLNVINFAIFCVNFY